MLEKLTKSQEKDMIVVRDRWINQLNSCPKINKKEAKKWITWLYKLSGLKAPKIEFLDSPLACQYAANKFRNNVGSSVENSVGSSVRNNVWNSVRNNVGNNVENSVGSSVVNNVVNSVRNSVGSSVCYSVGNSVGSSEKLKYFSFCNYGDISDYGWVSFCDFFKDKVKFNKETLKNLNNFIFLLKSGIFTMIQLEKYCFVSCMPEYIKRDDRQRLHSNEGSAIRFADGFEMFCLYGIEFKKEVFEKVTGENVSLKDILSLDDIDQRTAALKNYGIDKIIKSENCQLLDESRRGNKLYLISNVFERPVYYLGFTCPSTGKEYLEGVPEEVGKKEDADYAQATALGLTVEEYNNLEEEK